MMAKVSSFSPLRFPSRKLASSRLECRNEARKWELFIRNFVFRRQSLCGASKVGRTQWGRWSASGCGSPGLCDVRRIDIQCGDIAQYSPISNDTCRHCRGKPGRASAGQETKKVGGDVELHQTYSDIGQSIVLTSKLVIQHVVSYIWSRYRLIWDIAVSLLVQGGLCCAAARSRPSYSEARLAETLFEFGL